MKIALLGYGKMGKEIEKIALSRGHSIVLKINDENLQELTDANLKKADVAIEFSTPETAVRNIHHCFSVNAPIVVGTTGWLEKWDEIIKSCKVNEQTLFYASNYSLGVNLFFALNRQLAKMMNNYKEYDVDMTEIHHVHKKDKPSGTGITLAKELIEYFHAKRQWINEPSQNKTDLYVNSIRTDEVPGTHTVRYFSDIDDIEIKHVAHNRKGFALGAVMAAEWVRDKKGVFGMEEMLADSMIS
jgi:4-hydroxy-tetrahydrodipicolinate reductase